MFVPIPRFVVRGGGEPEVAARDGAGRLQGINGASVQQPRDSGRGGRGAATTEDILDQVEEDYTSSEEEVTHMDGVQDNNTGKIDLRTTFYQCTVEQQERLETLT
jgi:hypothetical protein